MNELNQYAISFENGSNLFINATSMVDAVGEGVENLLKCLPEGFQVGNLVPTMVRRCGTFCRMCGKAITKDGLFTTLPADGSNMEMKICTVCTRRILEIT